MKIEGMRTVRGAISRLAAVAALASGLAIASPARADTWQDALRDADDLHEAAEELHERALRLDDHHVLPLTAALDHEAADLYHELKHHPSPANVVPALQQTEAVLNQTSSAIALSHDMHHDRKAMALLKDIRHHLVDTAEHIECVLHDHHGHHAPPPVRYSPPRAPWYGHLSPPAVWKGGYRGPAFGYEAR